MENIGVILLNTIFTALTQGAHSEAYDVKVALVNHIYKLVDTIKELRNRCTELEAEMNKTYSTADNTKSCSTNLELRMSWNHPDIKKIQLIKAFREHTHCLLREAKTAIENTMDAGDWYTLSKDIKVDDLYFFNNALYNADPDAGFEARLVTTSPHPLSP